MHTISNGSTAPSPAQRFSRQVSIDAPSLTLNFRRTQTLYHHGDEATSLFRVTEGLIRIARMTPDGRNPNMRHVEPGDFFGEEAFMNGIRDETAEALTDARVEAIDPAMISNDDLMSITHSLARQIRRLLDEESHVQRGDLRQRVARYLLKLANTPLAEIDEHGRTVISATDELIAEGTASTRAGVTKIMTDLTRTAHISARYRYIALLDMRGLTAIADATGADEREHKAA